MKDLIKGIGLGIALDAALRISAEVFPMLKKNVPGKKYVVLHYDDALVIAAGAAVATENPAFGAGMLLGHLIASYTAITVYARKIGEKVKKAL